MRTRLLIILPLVTTLNACAFSEDVVDMPYSPAPARLVARAAAVTLHVTDARTSNRARISMKMNGYGMDAAAIRTARPVIDIVRQAVQAEFAERGFTTAASPYIVSISVRKFYNSFGVGLFTGNADGTVELAVAVSNPAAAQAYSRVFSGSSHKAVLMASGSNAAASVTDALHDAITQMFADPAFIGALTGSEP